MNINIIEQGEGQNRPSLFANSLDLGQTLDCGQAFRWKEENGIWTGTAGVVPYEKTLSTSQQNLSEIENIPFWNNYFDMSLDYGEIKRDLSRLSPVMKKACEFSPGIRILNQDKWETLCSFIISQNNNIKRIKGIVQRLCLNYGNGGFPSSETVASLSDEQLRAAGLGFRSGYLHDAAVKVSCNVIKLEEISLLKEKEAREELMRIKGVGPKVADCTLLFGFHRLESFPLDVWMKRIMSKYFPDKDRTFFGPFAGIAQQYLFNFGRNNIL